jgi:hypothetical protein
MRKKILGPLHYLVGCEDVECKTWYFNRKVVVTLIHHLNINRINRDSLHNNVNGLSGLSGTDYAQS